MGVQWVTLSSPSRNATSKPDADGQSHRAQLELHRRVFPGKDVVRKGRYPVFHIENSFKRNQPSHNGLARYEKCNRGSSSARLPGSCSNGRKIQGRKKPPRHAADHPHWHGSRFHSRVKCSRKIHLGKEELLELRGCLFLSSSQMKFEH